MVAQFRFDLSIVPDHFTGQPQGSTASEKGTENDRHRKRGRRMSGRRSLSSRLFEGLGRVTWGYGKRKLDERRARKRGRR